MRFNVGAKVLGICWFASTLCAQQRAPVYPVNAGQGQLSGKTPGQPGVDGPEFTPTVYIKNGDTLMQQTLARNDIKKAIIVFYSVACPHCDTLLATLAPYISKLKKAGINLILMNVPAGDKLGQTPTTDEYDQAVSKVTAHGIKVNGKSVKVVVVADVATLSQNGITGLPVMMVIKESVEQSRAIGKGAIQKVNFGDAETFSQLQAVFNDVSKSEDEDDEKQQGADKARDKASGKGKKATKDIVTPHGVDKDLAREWTAILNSECGQSLPGNTAIPSQSVQKQELPIQAPKQKQKRKCVCGVG